MNTPNKTLRQIREERREFNIGYKRGIDAKTSSYPHLVSDNVRKANSVTKFDPPYVIAYWSGWLAGFQS